MKRNGTLRNGTLRNGTLRNIGRERQRRCGVETITSSHKKQTLHMGSQYFRHSFPLLAIGFTSLCLN